MKRPLKQSLAVQTCSVQCGFLINVTELLFAHNSGPNSAGPAMPVQLNSVGVVQKGSLSK